MPTAGSNYFKSMVKEHFWMEKQEKKKNTNSILVHDSVKFVVQLLRIGFAEIKSQVLGRKKMF